METENILVFDLVDIFGVCDAIYYPGSLWETETPIADIFYEISQYIPVNILVHFTVMSRTLRGWIPPSSVREAIQQVCFASRTVPKTGTYISVIDASLPVAGGTGYPAITDAEKSVHQKVSLLPQITDIELISHDYYKVSDADQTVEEVYSAWLEPGDYIIAFEKPYWKVWGEGAGASPIFIATEDDRVITTEDSGTTWPTARIATESETYEYGSNTFLSMLLRQDRSICGDIAGCLLTGRIHIMLIAML